MFISEKHLPCILHTGDSLAYKVCFSPKGDAQPLNSIIIAQLNCNDQIKIPISAFVKATDIFVSNLDFGDVKVGSDSCDYIFLVNKGNVPITVDTLTFKITDTQFVIDTLGIFPKILNPKDTLKVKVCFTPLASG